MKVVFLGTSSGTPTKTRNVSGIAIKSTAEKSWILVDCGEGTQHQIQHTKLSLQHLSTICITHVHGDHCYGLPGLLASAAMSGKTSSLNIIAPKPIKTFLNSVIETTDLHLGYDINFVDVTELTNLSESDEIQIRKIELSHRVPSFGYIFEQHVSNSKLDINKLEKSEIPRGTLWGKLQQGEDIVLASGEKVKASEYLITEISQKKVIICGDNDKPGLLTPEIEDTDLVVHESTYTKNIAEKVGPGPQHSYAERVAKFAENVGLPNLILTHFSARYKDDISKPGSIAEIEKEALDVYRGNLFIAKDLDEFIIDKNNKVILEKKNDQ